MMIDTSPWYPVHAGHPDHPGYLGYPVPAIQLGRVYHRFDNKLIQTFLKMDLRRSGFIFPRFEFIIYGKLPFQYTYGFLERIND